MARLFGFVYPSSQLHVLGTLQGKVERWLRALTLLKTGVTEPTLGYDLRPWILNHDGKTVIRTTIKHWESTSAQPVSSNTVPLDIYNMQPDPTAAPAGSLPLPYDDYTMETWPNPTGYAYSEMPDASLYKLVRMETRDPTDALVSRRNWDIRLTRNVAVLVDIYFGLYALTVAVTAPKIHANHDLTFVLQLGYR
ncbi:hypothetical protein M407DRAFT_230302 [Tulasnella calospora MUT 4182]|uniref:Uncharacterized protein n=1 Tax=Tulasnella calospora MUT 4182 TaxID=1051891 RepID=A0A0C3K6A3_9AGAM|nr:hypothetical protein M407DRAFT_230302 [Tulasnella calospora MUT 4182]